MAERDESGRFEAGTSGNPVGRPRGAANRLNREVREMLHQALEEEGGVEYLRWAARKQPVAFLSLIGRLLPAEVRASLETGPVEIHVVTGIDGAPGSRWADNCKAEQRQDAALGPGEPPSESSDAAIELVSSGAVEMEHVEPDSDNRAVPETWVPLRPDENERPKVAQLD